MSTATGRVQRLANPARPFKCDTHAGQTLIMTETTFKTTEQLLTTALEKSEDDEIIYHLRQALQLLFVAEYRQAETKQNRTQLPDGTYSNYLSVEHNTDRS